MVSTEVVSVIGKGKVRNHKAGCPKPHYNLPTHQDKVVELLEKQLLHNLEQLEKTGSDYWKGAVGSVERQIELAKEGNVEVLSRFVIGESRYRKPEPEIDMSIREYFADWAQR